MRAVVMRVKEASVKINKKLVANIDKGLLIYLGIGKDDTELDLEYLVDKVINLRIFSDQEGKMNLSLKDQNGKILVVSQFTLYGDARKGRRPSYSDAANGEQAISLYEKFLVSLRKEGFQVEAGEFKANMQVFSINDGPVTILLDSKKLF